MGNDTQMKELVEFVAKALVDEVGKIEISEKKNVDFARVSFQFLARGLRAVRAIPGLTTCLGRSFQGLH